MHIGLIGGIGPAATEYYYRGLIGRHAGSGTALDLTIVHAEVTDLARNLANRDAHRQADIFARLVHRLAAAGAEAAAITSMGGHFCVRELEAISPLPILDGIPAVDMAIGARTLGTVGIIGTGTVMETRLHGGLSVSRIVVPEGDAFHLVHDAYVEMARNGIVTDAQRQVFFDAGLRLCRQQGAEAVILGGTDLFLAFEGHDPGFPVIDCAAIHIDAIYRRSTGQA
jgi:aspartate racemase